MQHWIASEKLQIATKSFLACCFSEGFQYLYGLLLLRLGYVCPDFQNVCRQVVWVMIDYHSRRRVKRGRKFQQPL